jgi:hypothetical protein
MKIWLSFLPEHMIRIREQIMSQSDTSFWSVEYSTGLNAPVKDVLHKICDIDLCHEVALLNLDYANIDKTNKDHLRQTLTSEHQDRRQPYVDFLKALWRQYNQRPFAARSGRPL